MMKKFSLRAIKKIFVMLTLLCLLICAIGCGGSGDGGSGKSNKSGRDKSVSADDSGDKKGSDDGKGSANVDIPSAKGDGSFMIYRIGTDMIAVVIKSKEVAKLKPKGEYEESMWHMSVRDEEWNFRIGMSTFSAYADIKIGNTGTESDFFNAHSEYGDCVIDDETYMAVITGEGLCDRAKATGDLYLYIENYEANDNGPSDITKIDASKVFKDVSLYEFGDVYGKVRNVNTPKGNWAGTYLTEGYGDFNGTAKVEITESGVIYIVVDVGEGEQEFIAWEEPYDSGDPDYFYADAKIINQSPNNNTHFVNMQYSSRVNYEGKVEDGFNFSISDYSTPQGGYKSASFDKFVPWHAAPDGYEDKDLTGRIARKDPEDSKYFTPATDDYIIDALYDNEGTNGNYDLYNLKSFDTNGRAVQYSVKKVFDSAESAQKEYNDYTTYTSDSVQYVLDGKIMYTVYDPVKGSTYRNSKWSSLESFYGSSWYIDCHYSHEYKSETSGDYRMQLYVSKPYTKKEYNAEPMDAAYWNGRNINGTHNSTIIKNSYLYTYSNHEGNIELMLDGNADADGNSYAPLGELRFFGKSALAYSASRTYINTDTVYVIAVTELEFDDKEANVTQYQFVVEDPFTMDITFDNYKSKTADRVFKNTFDMTRTQ